MSKAVPNASSTIEPGLDPYSELPLVGPYEVAVGHALITMVEPHLGHERAYNRWYEDDHFFSGAMFMPWMFAGRRWVAPRELQALRYPDNASVLRPINAGCYLGTYWITPDRLTDHQRWTFATNRRLAADGRVNRERTHVYTSFQDRLGTVYAHDEVPRDVFALMDPHPGLVLEVIDAPDPETRAELARWLLTDYLPSRAGENSPIELSMLWRTSPVREDIVSDPMREFAQTTDNDGRRLTVLSFLAVDPRECWDGFFAHEDERIASSGFGELSLLAPFIPARMGTNTYDDNLRHHEGGA